MDQSTVVKIFVIFILLFSFGLCVASFVSAHQCFTTPCYEGEGLEDLWTVTSGISFQLVTLAITCFINSVVSYWTLFKFRFDEMKYGRLIAATLVLAIALGVQAVYYGQYITMLNQLYGHLNGYHFHEVEATCSLGNSNATACELLRPQNCEYIGSNCVKYMSVNMGLKTRFKAVTAISVILAVIQTAFVVLLWRWRKAFAGEELAAAEASAAESVSGRSRITSGTYKPPTTEEEFEAHAAHHYQSENLRL